MKSIALMAAALFAAANAATTTKPTTTTSATPTKSIVMGVQEPSAAPTLNVVVVQGCFRSSGELNFTGVIEWNSKGSCVWDVCHAGGYAVGGTSGGNECYCGDKYPSKTDLVDDSKCNVGCTGFGEQACGGNNFWTIYNSGKIIKVEDSPKGAGKTTTGGETETPTSLAPQPTSTVVLTETISPTAAPSSSTNVAGIAAGVVVGVVVVGAVIAGMFFCLRRKRNKEIEEEHRRNAAVSSISGKPPSSSGGMSILDARLDPVLAHRRMSDGSIADNQDYSRKILRVTNA